MSAETAPGGTADIRVVLVDDHAGFRAEARLVLEATPGIRVVADAEDAAKALVAIETHAPDVAILDLEMPGGDGFALARAIRDRGWGVGLVLLTVHCSDALVRKALTSGFGGFVTKERLVELAPCVSAVQAGRRYVSAPVGRGADMRV